MVVDYVNRVGNQIKSVGKLCVDPVNSIVNQETVFLSGEQIVDKRPEYEFHSSMNGYGDEDSFVPSVMDRYRQLLLPALQVISTILASLGPQHREASMKNAKGIADKPMQI
ncbi:predicted protein [Nematostella vectensis]|uniref:Uncharacterized protein n=1 Tax=Nematostella vectensis TaxID=45351 RepID=A7TAB1_NEMVE|nr:predicted protein [Nematostella vectensis]|eukprot:XP_001619160.1 hypothetical protein NEMVEDRAFT_v1g224438 [Nematostella vectensis]